MDNTYLAFDELKKLYPDEWVLLGEPEMKNIQKTVDCSRKCKMTALYSN